jgi:hypothetical protein
MAIQSIAIPELEDRTNLLTPATQQPPNQFTRLNHSDGAHSPSNR